MASPASAPVSTLLQSCADAFRSFEIRKREQHPRSEVHFVLLDGDRIAAHCPDCDDGGIIGYLRVAMGSDLVMAYYRDSETNVCNVWTLDSFAEMAAATLLRTRRFRARRQ